MGTFGSTVAIGVSVGLIILFIEGYKTWKNARRLKRVVNKPITAEEARKNVKDYVIKKYETISPDTVQWKLGTILEDIKNDSLCNRMSTTADIFTSLNKPEAILVISKLKELGYKVEITHEEYNPDIHENHVREIRIKIDWS